MKSYIVKPTSVKKSQVFKNDYSFSPSNYKKIECKNKNIVFLKDIIEKNIKGFEPGSEEYVKFGEKYFVRISELDDLNFTFQLSKNSTKKLYRVKENDRLKIIEKGDICYQTASNVGNVCFYNDSTAYYNSHIRKLKFSRDRYYIFAILKSKFGKEQVNVEGSIKGVDNFKENNLLYTKVPFPTFNNNRNPANVERLVSLFVQNIVNKEDQIKIKNKQIDVLIKKELKENQKNNQFDYSYPKINDIKKEGRWDTGIFEKDYKNIEFLINNYKHGFFYLEDNKISPGTTPDDYHYSSMKRNSNFYLWVTPKNINRREFSFKTYIYTKKKTKVKINSLIMNGIRYVGNGVFSNGEQVIYTNQNTLIINQFDDSLKQLFLFCFLTSEIGKKMQMTRRCFGIVPILYTEHLCRIPIPNFPEKIQKEVSQLYYNNFDKNNNVIFDNYLELEKKRNKKIGIFQLNMEIFELKQKLDDIVHKIVVDDKIEINFKY